MKEQILGALVFIGLLSPLVGIWVIGSFFESRTFNRITGAHTTTWDAMWLELRVQEAPSKQ